MHFKPVDHQFPIATCPMQGAFTFEKQDELMINPAFHSGTLPRGVKTKRQLENAALLQENKESKVESISVRNIQVGNAFLPPEDLGGLPSKT